MRRQVLILVKRGLSNQQIADRLGIVLSTVKSHIGSLTEDLLRIRIAESVGPEGC